MWQCKACSESVDSAFDHCWNCGADLAGTADPTFVHADLYSAEFEHQPLLGRPRFTLLGLLSVTTLSGVLLAVYRHEPLAIGLVAYLIAPLAILLLFVCLCSIVYALVFRCLRPPKDQRED